MRLTCPNCDARYEVPDEVIPTDGRDVQCSNCGLTWFQHHPDHAPTDEDEGAAYAADAPDPDEEVAPPPRAPAPAQPERRELDPAVADILRAEAEAEFEARRKREANALESQPDLGLDAAETGNSQSPMPPDADREAEQRALEARRRMARMRGEPEPGSEAAAAAAAVSSRRQLLPDIEEINSTLRSDTSPSVVDPDAREELGAGGAPKRKNGFRRGFLSMILIAVVLLLAYLYAPQIAQAVPALDPLLNNYVVAVDQLRLSLSAQGTKLLDMLNDANVPVD